MNDDEMAGVLSHLYHFSENLHYPLSLFWKLEPHPAAVRREGRGPSSIHAIISQKVSRQPNSHKKGLLKYTQMCVFLSTIQSEHLLSF